MAPMADSNAGALRWQDVTPEALWPCTNMFFLSCRALDGSMVWGYIWQRASDNMYSWNVIRNPESDTPIHYNSGWTYDTVGDAVYWVLDSLAIATSLPVPSFPVPSFPGSL